MTMLLTRRHFATPAPLRAARVVEGLAGEIDEAAEAAAPDRRFLRQAWFAAALAAYGGEARTVVVENGRGVAAALPLTGFGPKLAGLAALPGCYWPMRSAPIAMHADDGDLDRLLGGIARAARGVRIGPVMDDDPLVARLIPRARAASWTVIERMSGDSWRLPVPVDGDWPRPSTAKRNRWFEARLSEHGPLAIDMVDGWAQDSFDRLARIEAASWVGTDTDRADAKFVAPDHAAFWRAATADPVLATMLHAAMLTLGGRDAAFTFGIDCGARRHIIANGFDPAFAAHSPGRVLAWRDLAQARGAGIAEVDWGAGDSGYKRQFGAERGPAIRNWLLVRPGVGAGVAKLLSGIGRKLA
ncbi:GNAT family N-acetyltransferase [Sphingomonas gilva]|uniref:GNAT family N-acetyltransferase n=1 Tax=Sphingomonas gilva TaxID=2305907 RepID=A0A396RV03_9SPHN|nr:GNAT family N-acetyltransferase [Sphingomonas gilva]RHW18293.1 GNAT family N-acetyltransferase [Sphingomonas gilva]